MNTLVLTILVKSSLLIGIAFAVNRLLLRRRSAASRHLVWTLALGGVLLLPLLSTTIPGWEIKVRVPAEAPAPVTILAAGVDTPAEPILTSEPIAPAIGPAIEASGGFEPAATPARAVNWTGVALAIYATGVLLLGLRLAMDRLALRRLVRLSSEVTDPAWRELLHDCEILMGVSKPVRLLRSLDRSMPMAFGVSTPTILIPAVADTWSEDRRRAVLLHEMAHIDRRDCLTQLIASLTCAAYWMHPGVWWVARRLRVERELACDDRVLAAGTVARDYAGHLLELAYSLGGYRAPALVVSMARPRQLEGRMLAVLDAARNRVTPTLRARVIGLLATAALVLPLAAAEAIVVADSSEEPRMVAAVEPAPEPAPAPQAAPRASEKAQPKAVPSEDKSGERRRREIQLPGTWEARLSDEANRIYLRLSERRNSNHGFDIALDQLEGLSSSTLTGGGGNANFSIRREAGNITFEGSFRSGVGAGTFDFTPNPAFPAEMVKRGFASPTTTEQYLLARGNIGVAFLDELNTQKYEKPTLDDLVRAADHGVHLEYLRGMGAAGYRLGQLSALIRTRDHGVTPEYARTMADEGFKNLTAEELVRARDHGVDPRYVKVMNALGYTGLKLDELIRARDHGVSEDYIRGMMGVSPERLSLPELVRARDHGVTPEYVKAMRDAGYGDASIQDLVRARDHGVSGDFAKGMLGLGLVRPGLEELVNARDHGVTPEYVKAWLDLGYKPALAEMVRARDHGVEPEFAKSLNALGYERLTINELVRLRDHGVSASFVREQNATPQGKLSVDELVRRRDRM